MLRVLVVEDNSLFREVLSTSLRERFPSAFVEEAGNGEEALQRISCMPPDFIFTDMSLAGMNGLELARKIKNDFPATKIAMLTGYDFSEYRQTAGQYGVDRFFVKDYLDWKEIKEFVQGISPTDR